MGMDENTKRGPEMDENTTRELENRRSGDLAAELDRAEPALRQVVELLAAGPTSVSRRALRPLATRLACPRWHKPLYHVGRVYFCLNEAREHGADEAED